eukprot:TRINITY_DN50497_c0_g1_i1.p1 TRINITY_DN50497_c0_g1~~TRINITY_DN50497_c0_g1_i1.p1  ORF type:complete len:371 (+),score=104.63 TRINITY_DN50497_c0_g1_i1:44-1156(+)
MSAKPLRGRAAAEAAAAAKARDAAALTAQGRGRAAAEAALAAQANPPPPAAVQPSRAGAGSIPLDEAAELLGGPVPLVPWYSGLGGDAPVLAEVDGQRLRKMREEFEGAAAEYRIQSQKALAGLNSKEGKTFQKRFDELEQSWGAFQWTQKSRSIGPAPRTTRAEVQAASAALAHARWQQGLESQGLGLDLQQEVDNVLDDLWDSLEKPKRQEAKANAQAEAISDELDRLEFYIEQRIREEEEAERERTEAERRPLSGAVGPSRITAVRNEGTGGTPLTSSGYAASEMPALKPSSLAFGQEVKQLRKEFTAMQSIVSEAAQPQRRGGAAWMGDLAGGSGPALQEFGEEWGHIFAPARAPAEPRPRPRPTR